MAKRKPKKKNAAAVALGSRGGKKRARNLTAAERKASAVHAITARWDRERQKAEAQFED